MADAIPDLWSNAIELDDISPAMILLAQADIIEKRTKGLITAEVIQRNLGQYTELLFDIKSQSARHRSRLLVCRYLGDEVYPAYITSSTLYRVRDLEVIDHAYEMAEDVFKLDDPDCRSTEITANQEEFTRIVARVLQSGMVRSKISSMIARSNEAKQPLSRLIVEEAVAKRSASSEPAE